MKAGWARTERLRDMSGDGEQQRESLNGVQRGLRNDGVDRTELLGSSALQKLLVN